MARTPADRSTRTLRDQLAEASDVVTQAGRADLAPAIQTILAPGGWEQLRSTDPVSEGAKENLAFTVPASIRDQINAAVAADPEAVSLTAKVTEGFNKYLSGEFTLRERSGARPVAEENWVNMNIRTWASLRKAVADKVRAEVGGRAGPGRVAAEYLMSSYGLGPFAPDYRETVLPRGAERRLMMPREVRDQITAGARASGDRVTDIVNEGFQKFLDGTFVPEPPMWPGTDDSDLVPLKVFPADDLFDRVKEAGKGRSGGTLRPSQVAAAYLLEEFGLVAGQNG